MKVLEYRLHRLKLPLKTPYRLSYRTVTAFEPIVVEAVGESGRSGWGEGHISPGSSAETPEGGWAFCRDAATRTVGMDGAAAAAEIAGDYAAHPVAATCLTAALSMMDADGILAPPETEVRLPLLSPVNALEPDAIQREIDGRIGEGFRTFKIKVGKDVEGDLERVRAIQRAVHGRASTRIDANRAYSVDQASRFAEGLDPDGVELFEQPCDADDWDGNAAVANISPVPLMLDEPIQTIADIERAAAIPGVGLCKLKLKRSGGLRALDEALARVRDLGMEPVLGDGLGTEINCWMEAMVGRRHIRNAGEFNGFLKPAGRLFTEPLSVEAGDLVLPAGYTPEMDRDALAELTIEREIVSA